MVRGEGWRAAVPGSLELGPSLRLASETTDHDYAEVVGEAEARLARVPGARDAFGGRAFYDGTAQAVLGTSDFPGAEKIVDLAAPANARLFSAFLCSSEIHSSGSKELLWTALTTVIRHSRIALVCSIPAWMNSFENP